MGFYEKASNFLANPEFFIFNYTLIKSTLDYLTPSNSIIVIGTRKIKSSSNPNCNIYFTNPSLSLIRDKGKASLPLPELQWIEPYFSTPFTFYDIPSFLSFQWSHPSMHGNVNVPHLNPYIIDEGKLDWCCPKKKYPAKIIRSVFIEMWTHTDNFSGFMETISCNLFGKTLVDSFQAQGKTYIFCQ